MLREGLRIRDRKNTNPLFSGSWIYLQNSDISINLANNIDGRTKNNVDTSSLTNNYDIWQTRQTNNTHGGANKLSFSINGVIDVKNLGSPNYGVSKEDNLLVITPFRLIRIITEPTSFYIKDDLFIKHLIEYAEDNNLNLGSSYSYWTGSGIPVTVLTSQIRYTQDGIAKYTINLLEDKD